MLTETEMKEVQRLRRRIAKAQRRVVAGKQLRKEDHGKLAVDEDLIAARLRARLEELLSHDGQAA